MNEHIQGLFLINKMKACLKSHKGFDEVYIEKIFVLYFLYCLAQFRNKKAPIYNIQYLVLAFIIKEKYNDVKAF